MQQLIDVILNTISPHLRKMIIEFVKTLDAAAQKTPNPIDDILVALLKVFINITE